MSIAAAGRRIVSILVVALAANPSDVTMNNGMEDLFIWRG